MKNYQWEAIFSNNQSYDGEFYYALSITKTICRPSCPSRTPNPKNVSIFSTVEEAIQQGFRPCHRCKPNQLAWTGYKKELADQTKQYIDLHCQDPITLETLHEALEKNLYYIQRSFKEVWGITPLHYLHQVRIDKSKELLKKSAYSITAIGLEVGYNDSAQFTKKFKVVEGTTPKAFRKMAMN